MKRVCEMYADDIVIYVTAETLFVCLAAFKSNHKWAPARRVLATVEENSENC